MSPTSRAARPRPDDRDDDLGDEVLEGLRAEPKTASPKFFYDERGAALFESICEQPEYYLTRCEVEILRAHAADIAELAGPSCALIEYGSGAGLKVRILLDAFERPTSYTPVDISAQQLAAVAASIRRDYPGLVVRPVSADYTKRVELPQLPRHTRRRVGFFPGSTIGNFHPMQAVSFLRHVRRTLGPGGALLLGVDRRKSVDELHAAYNDAAGVTAAFNLNLLARLNRDLGADFDVSRFEHVAFYDENAGRIEMHLEALTDQVVSVGGESVRLERGERIWTESSYKYDLQSLEAVVTSAGFTIDRLLSDAGERFWVAYLL